ncbi:PIG-L deacetylase family protein [Ulvibacterium sp.]|uniref:PIG-L deacetylase family protein n=1 Tax=Ulvibacterium sp. TaxID=2665914 RepID=UPI0026380123|nr:PIG-L family deacetylase [Ulvibacterium sp.]
MSAQENPLNIIVFGAHPDDCDIDAGGTAILFSKMGHKVKFVSLTNGDAGHYAMGGGELAKIRFAEAQEAGKRFGVEYTVLGNHDGELMPTLENRLKVIREIRKWNADIVIAPRPNDYHPDHRYAAILVQDAAYMVIVPNVAADTPPLEKNPVFLYSEDGFQKPNPFEPDIAIIIDDVFNQKIYAMAAHESQFFDWLPWTSGNLDKVPKDEKGRLEFLANWRSRGPNTATLECLKKWYGAKALNAKHAEGFEICEYGKQPSETEIQRLFPMLKKQ